MGLFNKKNPEERPEEEVQEQPAPARNPNTMLIFRFIAMGYLLWMGKDMVQMYLEGGPEAPTLGMLLGAMVLFVGGPVVIGILTYQQYKQMKAQQAAEAEALALLEAEEAAEEGEEAPEEIPEDETEE